MKTVYAAESALDAQLIYDQLVAEGFEVFISGLSLTGALGELPANLGPEVKVIHEQHYLQARALVEAILLENAECGDAIQSTAGLCPDCSEVKEAGFSQCWNCGCIFQPQHENLSELLKASNLVIRDAIDSDSEAVSRLIFSVLDEYGLKPDKTGIDADLWAIESNYQKNGGILWVVEDPEHNIIATTALAMMQNSAAITDVESGKIVELRKMYITAEYRHKGLGKLLLERSINWCQQNNVIKIRLETASVLKSAIALYLKYGFIEMPAESNEKRCNRQFELLLTEAL